MSIHTDGQCSRLFLFRLIHFLFFCFVIVCLDLPSIDVSICLTQETIVQDQERERKDRCAFDFSLNPCVFNNR
jgi:hypothetical protein